LSYPIFQTMKIDHNWEFLGLTVNKKKENQTTKNHIQKKKKKMS